MHSLLLCMGEPGAAFKVISALTSILCFLFYFIFFLLLKTKITACFYHLPVAFSGC